MAEVTYGQEQVEEGATGEVAAESEVETSGQEVVGTTGSEGLETERPRYKIRDKEYDEDEILDAIETKGKVHEWNRVNTERAREIKKAREELERVKILEEFLSSKPEAYQEVEALFKKYEGGKEVKIDDKVIEASMERVAEKRAQAIAEAEREAKIEISRDMEILKNQYGELFKENPKLGNELFEYALKVGDETGRIPPLKMAFKDLMFDKLVTSNIKKALDQEDAKRKDVEKIVKMTPAGSAGVKVPGKVFKGSIEEAKKAMLKDPRFGNFMKDD